MVVTNFIPDEKLRPFIREIMVIESGDIELENRLIPSTPVTLAFRIKGENSYATGSGKEVLPAAIISVLRNSVRVIPLRKTYHDPYRFVSRARARMFFNLLLNELFGQSIDLCEVFGSSAVKHIERKPGKNSVNNQLAASGRFLTTRISLKSFLKSVRNPYHRVRFQKRQAVSSSAGLEAIS